MQGPPSKPPAGAAPRYYGPIRVAAESAAPGAQKPAASDGPFSEAGLPKAEPVSPSLPRAIPVAPAAAARPQGEHAEFEIVERRRGFFSRLLQQTPSWLVSMVFHMTVLLVMALWTENSPGHGGDDALVVLSPDARPGVELLAPTPQVFELPAEKPVLETPPPSSLAPPPKFAPRLPRIDPTKAFGATVEEAPPGPVSPALANFTEEVAQGQDLLAETGAAAKAGDLNQARSGAARVASHDPNIGATKESEQAVNRALKWISRQQNYDGSWSFGNVGKSGDPGALRDARIAATAMALLPFLGAGHTHKEGDYQKTVNNGLMWLSKTMVVADNRGSLYEPGGFMYSHGLASITLCEAFAMTKDRKLYAPAQMSLNFISYAQDPIGGGWRYRPREPGDTSVFGWQVMALKSGNMAYLSVDPHTIDKAKAFLNKVQANSGANYGYVGPGQEPGTTAIGLLCRMYLGWKKDNPALMEGVEYLSNTGPSNDDIYFDYYATQVMRHYGGEPWKVWNPKMRDYLVSTQAKSGHAAGSWHFADPHGALLGGRLYSTSLACMTLEVYYRHLPLYKEQSVTDDFAD